MFEKILFPILSGQNIEKILNEMHRSMEDTLERQNLGFPFTDMFIETMDDGRKKTVIEIAAAGYDKAKDIEIVYDPITNEMAITGKKGINETKSENIDLEKSEDKEEVEESEIKNENIKYIHKNISYKKFIRKVKFLTTIDEDSIKASSNNGILRIEVTESKNSNKQKIKID